VRDFDWRKSGPDQNWFFQRGSRDFGNECTDYRIKQEIDLDKWWDGPALGQTALGCVNVWF